MGTRQESRTVIHILEEYENFINNHPYQTQYNLDEHSMNIAVISTTLTLAPPNYWKLLRAAVNTVKRLMLYHGVKGWEIILVWEGSIWQNLDIKLT